MRTKSGEIYFSICVYCAEATSDDRPLDDWSKTCRRCGSPLAYLSLVFPISILNNKSKDRRALILALNGFSMR